jgi:crossover junction endodeoxyribonuclease RuvC
MKILAIDPGFERVGIAILEKTEQTKEVLLYSECFKTSSKLTHPERLRLIGEKISEIIKKNKPAVLSIEKLFFNTNTTTALGVAEARGVILYEASLAKLEIFEYTPLSVKVAVTGYGRSEKKQIMLMIPRLIDVSKKISSDDEFDAIALGITFCASDFHNKKLAK